MEVQNLSGKEVESSSNIISKKQQNVSKKAMSVYNKSYTRTQFESDFIYYTWEIDDFKTLRETLNDLTSPKFPETAQCQIKIKFYEISDYKIHFCFITKPFRGSCSISIKELINPYSDNANSIKKNMFKCVTNETTYSGEFNLNYIPKNLVITCSIQIIHQILNNTVHIPLFSTNLEVKKRILPICDSNSKCDDTKLIKFIINGQIYSVPKHILRATNSKYFKNLCEKNVKEDMTNEVNIQNNTEYFKIMLMYIQTGMMKQNIGTSKYELLLKIAHEYDVQHFKLICEQYLLRDVTKETAIKYIKLAWLYDAKYLADYAANIIKLYYDTIVPSEDFQLLQQGNVNKTSELIEKYKLYHISD
ncbi:speckle-type POZ protein homolog [Linepithema humile]|uniref:speckle-type POZ protein homolog n=1 Tax=Linepithema humile TaxID=83485 RepID=UPI00351E6724